MRRAAAAGFPFVLLYHSTQDTGGFWYRFVKDNFKGKHAKELFNFKIYIILLQKNKKIQKIYFSLPEAFRAWKEIRTVLMLLYIPLKLKQ